MTTESELQFSTQANHNFSRILTELKRSNLSITNRLRSVREDAYFIREVANALCRPLVANERCGSWYVKPEDKADSAYFKSTDGHTGQWKFSVRRLNLHLLRLIGENDGCIIVDSTRRGKRMPDALSKTVPIWCCVLNHALFPENSECHELYTPPIVVSPSEHAQIEARIPEHVRALQLLDVDLSPFRHVIQKPLRPMWITQESHLVYAEQIFDHFHPVICCTSSRRVLAGEMSEGGYIQGAGDDTENWALGLTPPVFWKSSDILSSTSESELPDFVRSLVTKESKEADVGNPQQVAPFLYVDRWSPKVAAAKRDADTCLIAFKPETTDRSSWIKSATVMEVGIGKHKLVSRNLRVALPYICEFAHRFLLRQTMDSPQDQSDGELPRGPEGRRVIIACEAGKDVSIGVALALSCRIFDNKGDLRDPRTPETIATKDFIKQKLSRIMLAYPDAKPSRATLQSVNSFLMG